MTKAEELRLRAHGLMVDEGGPPSERSALMRDLCVLVAQLERRLADLSMATRPCRWPLEMDDLMRRIVARVPEVATHDLRGYGLVFVVVPKGDIDRRHQIEVPDCGDLLPEAWAALEIVNRSGRDLRCYRGPDAALVVAPVA